MGAVVYRGFDPVEANLVLELLRAEDLAARIIGTQNATLIELPQTICEVRVEVDEDEAERAREILAGHLDGEAVDPAEDPQAREPAPEGPPAPLPRRPRLAAGCAFLFPGGAHFYARRPHAAILLGIGIVAAFVVAVAGRDEASTGGVLALIALVLTDAIGGMRASLALNRGERASTGRQLGFAFAAVLVALGGGQLVGHLLPPPPEDAQTGKKYLYSTEELLDPRPEPPRWPR